MGVFGVNPWASPGVSLTIRRSFAPSLSIRFGSNSNYRQICEMAAAWFLGPKSPDRFFHDRRAEVGVDGVVGGGRRGQADSGTVFRAIGHLQVLESPFPENLSKFSDFLLFPLRESRNLP